MRRTATISALVLVTFFLTGCAQAIISPTPLSPTRMATSKREPILFTPTATTTLPPTTTITSPATRTPTITPTLTPSPYPGNWAQLTEFVIKKLIAGQAISEIITELDEKNITLQSSFVDFDGDEVDELFLTGTMSQGDRVRTAFWIISRSQNDYMVVYARYPETFLYGADIYDIGDLNGDTLPDLLAASYGYGSGCGENLFVFGWRNTDYISYSAYTELCIENVEVDEINEIVLTGHESCWGSSGPGRRIKEYYQQDNTEYKLSYSEKLPSNYRIHVLSDAQSAYDDGNVEQAVQLWEQAAHDQSLINYPSQWNGAAVENDKPEIYQPAFALYRLYTYYLITDNKVKAQQYLQELWDLVGDEKSPGGELLTLANEAKRLLDSSQDPEVVCNGIYEYLNSTDENIAFLFAHWYWGGLNDSVDFCPLRRQ